MKLRALAAGAAIAATAALAVPGIASADDPEFPRVGVMYPGAYHLTQHPSNVLGTPLADCDLHVAPDSDYVRLECAQFSREGHQSPVGPDQAYVTLDGVPFGLSVRDIDPRQGHWIGTINIAKTPIEVPYPFAGVTLQRR